MTHSEMKHHSVEIIAGPCSINVQNRGEIDKIAAISLPNGEGAVYATRVVGYKSRTELNPTGEGMGTDYHTLERALEDNEITEDPQSVKWAREIIRNTGLHVATEIMIPHIQLAYYQRDPIFNGRVMPWNPSVDQLGAHTRQIAKFAQRNNWRLGIKNGKDLGVTVEIANDSNGRKAIPLEKTWGGLATYAHGLDEEKIVFIQRGVNVPDHERGEYRNLPIHEATRRIRRRFPKAHTLFDPSHSFGPKMREQIVKGSIDALKMTHGSQPLYDGLLIECGTSDTDTDQHIKIPELQDLVHEINKFRHLRVRERALHAYYVS